MAFNFGAGAVYAQPASLAAMAPTMAMAPTNHQASALSITDWSQFLEEGSELPPDVTFNVLEQGEANEDEILNLEDWKTVKVYAHKFLLAGVSPVFRKEFFGSLRSSKDEVDIKETTIEAFTSMIHYVYRPDALKDITCPQLLCQVLNLAERYQINALKEYVAQTLQEKPITSHNLMFTATTAKNYAVFEDVSKMMINKCGDFLKSQLGTPDQIYDFLQASHSSFPEADTELLLELLRANGKCSNCKRSSNLCMDGQDVTFEALNGASTKQPTKRGIVQTWNDVMVSWITWAQGDCDCGFSCAIEGMPSCGLAEVARVQHLGTHNATLQLKCMDHKQDQTVRIRLFSSPLSCEVTEYQMISPVEVDKTCFTFVVRKQN